MKTKYVSLALILFVLGCKKKKPIDLGEFASNYNKPNEICFNMNEEKYPAIVRFAGERNSKIELYFSKLSSIDMKSEESALYARSIEKKIGIQRLNKIKFDSTDLLKPVAHFYTNSSDGDDVVADEYYMIESDSLNNFINIIEEGNNFHEIRGVFSMSLARKEINKYTQFPNLDTVRFRNCAFHLFLK
jgi:hypothetical protein